MAFQNLESNIAAAQTAPPKLTLEVSTSQNNYLLLEPIPIKFKLLNQTNVPIIWSGSLSLSENVYLLVKGGNGAEIRSESFFSGGGLIGSSVMQPGMNVEKLVLLNEKRSEMIFARPGRYEVRVEFNYYKNSEGQQHEKIFSNAITINIQEPQGINRQAYEYIKRTLEPDEFNVHPSQFVLLQQYFVNNFGNSVYGKYMVVKLAGTYEVLGEHAKAERELCRISTVNFYYSAQVRRDLMRIAARLRPMPIIPNLPENAPRPPLPQPCVNIPNN